MKFMKKPIMAAEDDIETIFNGAFSDIAYDFSKHGYEMKVDSDKNMTLTCEKDKEFMPEIKVNKVEEDGVYYYNADLKFPELKYDDMEFADSVHYWVEDKWAPLTKVITKLSKFGYNPREWEDSDDE